MKKADLELRIKELEIELSNLKSGTIAESLQREILFRQTIEKSIPSGIVVVDDTGKQVYVNPSFCNLVGWDETELLEKHPPFLYWSVQDLENINNAFQQTLNNNAPKEGFDLIFCHKTGKLFPVNVIISPFLQENNKLFFLANVIDISERKMAEEKIHVKDALLNLTGHTAKVGGWEIDTETMNLSWTEEVYKIHEVDFTFNPNLNKAIDFYAALSRPVIEKAVQQAIEIGEPFDLELEFITNKGNHRFVHSIGEVQQVNGKTKKVFGSIQDITNHRSAVEKLKQNFIAVSKLNQFALELSNLSSDENLEEFITKEVKEIACAEVATFSEYNSLTRTTTTKQIEIESELLKRVINLLGKQINEIHSVITEEDYRVITNEMIGVRKTLHEASFGAIPRLVGTAIQALLKVDRIIGVAYMIEGELYGTSLLLMEKGVPDPPKEILENFVALAAISLRRKRAEQLLEESMEHLNEAQKLAHIGVWDWKPDIDKVTWTDELYNIAGLDPMLPAPTYKEHSRLYTPASWELLKTGVEKAMKTGKSYQLELELIRPNGDSRYINTFGGAKFDSKGQVIELFGTVQDITERKKSEKELLIKMAEITTLNKELEIFAHANEELEQFAFIASHNLQQPLRTISNYTKIINEDYSEQIDDKGHQYLKIINDATKRMIIQLDSLLNFSRLGRNLNLTKVDCKKIIDNVVADLETIIVSSNASIEIDNMPVLNVYESEFSQLFQNLITNAIKFQKKGSHPKIKIKSEKINTKWKFSVSDNGIGIASKDFEKIFEIFQRLHKDADYIGHGIGLSFCRKIVQLHKGEMWVESATGHGTTFHFTIANLKG